MMRLSLVNIWAILVVWIVLSAVNFKKSDSDDEPSCPTCAEAKPLVTKYRYTSKKDHPVAILLSINSNGKARKTTRLNAIPINADLISESDDSDESLELALRNHAGKVSGHSRKALRKLIRPLLENGDLESTSDEEQVLDEWQCKRDELINLLRVVLKKKDKLLANKHGVIDSVLSDEDKLVVVTPAKKTVPTVVISDPVTVPPPPALPIPVPIPAPVPVAVPPPLPVPVPIPIPAPVPHDHSKEDCSKSFSSELKELLGHFPQVIRDKVSAGVQKMMEKINHTKLSDLKSAVKGVVLDLIKGIVSPSSKGDNDDSKPDDSEHHDSEHHDSEHHDSDHHDSEHHDSKDDNVKLDEKPSALKGVIAEVGANIIEKVVEKVTKKGDDSDSEKEPEEHSPIDKEHIKDLIVNFNPKALKEKFLQLIKKIIQELAEKGLDALHDLVSKLLKEFIEDLVKSAEKLEKLKPVIKKIGEKIIQGIKDIVEIAAKIEGDSLKEKVKGIIGKIIDDILECLYPDHSSGSSEPSDDHSPSKTSKQLITKALLAVVDQVFEELIGKKPEKHENPISHEKPSSEEMSKSVEDISKSVEDIQPIFSTIRDILDRLKQIPEIIQEKLLEGVKRIIGEIGKDQGPNLEELVEEIVEDILLGILSPDKPLPEPVRELLKPVTDKISDILLHAVKAIINEVANKNFEGIEEAVSNIVQDLIQNVIDFITGKEDDDYSNESNHSKEPIAKIVPEVIKSVVSKIVDSLKDKFSKDSEESSKSEEKCDDHIPSLTDIIKIGEIVLTGLKSILEKIGTEELKDLGELVTKILSTIPEEKIKGIVKPILEKLHEKLLDCLKNLLKLVLEEGLEGLGEKLKTLICNLLKDVLGPLVTKDCKSKDGKTPIEEIIENLLPIVGDIVEILSKGLKDKIDAIKNLLNIGEKIVEDVNESASHISEVKESKPSSSEEHKLDPIPEGLVSHELLPVINKIIDTLDQAGVKDNKNIIKEITDELLAKLLNLAPEKPHSHPHDDFDEGYESEEHHLDEKPQPEKPHPIILPSIKPDNLPEVVVLPTENDGTYRVSLNIDKLVDKEYVKYKNLRCKCMEGPIADERCPFHQKTKEQIKEEIKEEIKGKFFRKLIKGVPLAEGAAKLGTKVVSKVIEDVAEKAKESISNDHHEDNNDSDYEESAESEEDSKEEHSHEIIEKVGEAAGKVVGEIGKKAVTSIVQKVLSKLGKNKEEQKKRMKEIIGKIIAKFTEHASKSEGDSHEKQSKGEKIKEFLGSLLNELLDHGSSEDSRHKRQYDIDPVSLLSNDDCPTCLKQTDKRNTPEVNMEKSSKIVCHNQFEETDLEEHERMKRQNVEETSLRVERALGGGCSCGSSIWYNDYRYNSTDYYTREPQRDRVTRGDRSATRGLLQESNSPDQPGEAARLTLGDSVLVG